EPRRRYDSPGEAVEGAAEAAHPARAAGEEGARRGAQADEADRAAHAREGDAHAAHGRAAGTAGGGRSRARRPRAPRGHARRRRRLPGQRPEDDEVTHAPVMTVGQRRRLTAVARGQAVADALARSPLKFYWMIRVHAQARSLDEPRRYPLRDLARALAHPWSFAAGEVTRWPDVHDGRRDLLARLDLALRRGQRVEGHTAGAAGDKIAAIAAGGLTSDHEPITAREVLERARQGLGVMLRESSLRPDLVGLLDALKDAPALASRLMLTADGSMPAFIR